MEYIFSYDFLNFKDNDIKNLIKYVDEIFWEGDDVELTVDSRKWIIGFKTTDERTVLKVINLFAREKTFPKEANFDFMNFYDDNYIVELRCEKKK